MDVAVVLFTRDLRVHDQPVLADAAQQARCVVPLFVLDRELLDGAGCPNRVEFLLAALGDLRASLRGLGADLVVRRGEPVTEAVRIARHAGASAIFVSDDVSAYAHAHGGAPTPWSLARRRHR